MGIKVVTFTTENSTSLVTNIYDWNDDVLYKNYSKLAGKIKRMCVRYLIKKLFKNNKLVNIICDYDSRSIALYVVDLYYIYQDELDNDEYRFPLTVFEKNGKDYFTYFTNSKVNDGYKKYLKQLLSKKEKKLFLNIYDEEELGFYDAK